MDSGQWFHVRGIDFDGHRTHDDIDRQDEAKTIFLANQDAFHSGERPSAHSYAATDSQIRMRVCVETCCECAPQSDQIIFRHGCRTTVERDKTYGAGYV